MLRKALAILSLLLLVLALDAQDDRPKVGLVLSGGSAHGLAHIGVLKVLEEQGIHVDYITGTSMGSIIGGLYAMGYTAREIEELALTQDWSELLATSVPLRDIAPSEKAYHNRYPLTVKVKDGAFRLPEGFLNSHKLDIALNQMFLPAHEIANFDDLTIPFKCVAIDIEKGEIIVLDRGYLGTAIRASMAIPSVFAPVHYEDKLLVDGGLIRNFPVEEVIDMGADIVIGVYVGSRLEEKENLKTLLDILNQSAFMMGILDSDEQKKKVDILMEPDIKDFPTFGFELADVLIREGRVAAGFAINELQELARQQKKYNIPAQVPLNHSTDVDIVETRFPLLNSPYDALAKFKYGDHMEAKVVNLEMVEDGVSRVFGTKHFDNVNYTLNSDGEGEHTLEILATPRKVNTLSGAFNFFPSSGTALILTNESRNILARPSVLYTTVRAAQNFGIKSDYFYRLGDKKDFMLSVKGKLHRYDQNLFVGETLRQRFTELQGQAFLGVGYEPNNDFLISGDVGIDGFRLKPIGRDQDDVTFYGRLDGVGKANVTVDRLDDPILPTEGFKAEIQGEAHLLFANEIDGSASRGLDIPDDQTYVSIQLKAQGAFSVTDRVTIEGNLSAGYKSSPSLIDNYRVGGLEDRDTKSISMIGLNTHQLHFYRFAKGGVSARLKIGSSLFIGVRADRISGDRIFKDVDDTSDPRVDVLGVGGYIGVDTPIGPFRVALGRNDLTSSWNTNFAFGYTFF